jgi:hypothetical protein
VRTIGFASGLRSRKLRRADPGRRRDRVRQRHVDAELRHQSVGARLERHTPDAPVEQRSTFDRGDTDDRLELEKRKRRPELQAGIAELRASAHRLGDALEPELHRTLRAGVVRFRLGRRIEGIRRLLLRRSRRQRLRLRFAAQPKQGLGVGSFGSWPHGSRRRHPADLLPDGAATSRLEGSIMPRPRADS